MKNNLLSKKIAAISVVAGAVFYIALLIAIILISSPDHTAWFVFGGMFIMFATLVDRALSWSMKIISDWINTTKEYRGILADAEPFNLTRKK